MKHLTATIILAALILTALVLNSNREFLCYEDEVQFVRPDGFYCIAVDDLIPPESRYADEAWQTARKAK